MSSINIGVSGHRELNKPTEEVYRRFIRCLERIAATHKIEKITNGFALGFDSITAQAAIDLNIPLWAAIPFPGQQNSWPIEHKKKYEFFLSKAANVYIANDKFANWAFFRRNEYIVNNSDHMIVWLTENKGGTFHAVDYANSKKKQVTNIAIE